jgi:hypothetical protein
MPKDRLVRTARYLREQLSHWPDPQRARLREVCGRGEYGMAARGYGRSIEIDHIVSLELGGSNKIANLFPEPGSSAANYHVKDRLENRLHDMVCASAIQLSSARRLIAPDWISLYRRVFGNAP